MTILIDVINNSGSKHFNITELRSELYDLNIKGLFHPQEEHSKPQESSDSFDELFKGIRVDVNQLNISHFDIPEVWEIVEPFYRKFLLIYNDICSFNRMNHIEDDECVRMTYEYSNKMDGSKRTIIHESVINSVGGRLSATEFVYNCGGFKNGESPIRIDIVYK